MSERKTSKRGRAEGEGKYSMRYTLRFTFYVLLSLLSVYARAQEPLAEQLESDLPDEVIAEVIDTTRIVLEPRSRFSDPLTPELVHAIALYPKERLWNLPPAAAPQKAVKPTTPPPKNYRFNLTAYPSLPESLFYQVLFAGRMKKTHGFLYLNRQQFGNTRTKERGDYHLDRVRGGLSHQYQALSEISFDLGLNLKALEWLTAETNGENPNPQKDLLLFRSDLNWQQQISETTWSTLNLDTALLRVEHGESNLRDEAADLRFNFDMALSWPFLNPIHAGGHVEYFSATDRRSDRDTWATIFRLYARDEFTPFGPFVCSIGVEGVSLRERDDAGEEKASLQLNPSLALTTHLDKHWLIQFEGLRTTARPRLSPLYFDADYISFNPFLRSEKTWNERIALKYHHGAKFEVDLSGFARQIDDLVVLIPQTEYLKAIPQPTDNAAAEIAWIPTNIDASIYGG